MPGPEARTVWLTNGPPIGTDGPRKDRIRRLKLLSPHILPPNLARSCWRMPRNGSRPRPYIFEGVRPIEQPTIESTIKLSYVLYLLP
jgi:hypothetical protein